MRQREREREQEKQNREGWKVMEKEGKKAKAEAVDV